MSKHFFRAWMTAAAVAALVSTPAMAWEKGGKGNSHEAKARHEMHEHDRDWDDHHVGHVRRDHDDRDRDHHLVRTSGRPPGWSHGRKTGWGDCDVPPGQAKKIGCRHDIHRHHRVVVHRTPTTGTVIVRRPTGTVYNRPPSGAVIVNEGGQRTGEGHPIARVRRAVDPKLPATKRTE